MNIKKLNKKILMAATAIVLTIPLLGTVSYLMETDKAVNTFKIGTVDTEIVETFEVPDNGNNLVKKDVYFTNNGSTDVYIRAKVLIYYQDANGTILEYVPVEGENADYVIDWGDTFDENAENSLWLNLEGYYYYKPVLTEGNKTSNLIDSCTELNPKDDRYLVVDIVTQAIQATPELAVESAWTAVEVGTNGNLENKKGEQ